MKVISIILCVYNAEKYISEALESLENQTVSGFEVVLIDDGSTDGSKSIIDLFIDKGTLDIKYHYQKNVGLTVSLNRAIELAKGEYLARMDADDIATPKRLEESLKFLKVNDLDFMCTRAMRFDNHGEIGLFPRQNLHTTTALNNKIMKFGNMFAHGTFFAKTSVFKTLRYDEAYRTAQDYDFLCRLLGVHHFKVGYLNEVLYLLRVDNDSSGRSKNSKQLDNAVNICRKHFGTTFYLIPNANSRIKRFILSIGKRFFV
jgi:glycosyltransferase involved in cell wall biosynthesis